MKLPAAFCACLLLSFCLCAGQDIYSHYTVRNGLPTNKLNSIVQDREGYIWIAGKAGAVRYNGQSFKVYDANNHLRTNDVFDINIGADGRVYLMDYSDGLDYIRNDSVHTVKIPTNRSMYISVTGNAEYAVSAGYNYIISGDTALRIDAVPLLRKAGIAASPDSTFVFFRYPYLTCINSSDVYTADLHTGKRTVHTLPYLHPAGINENNGFIIMNYPQNRLLLYSPSNGRMRLIGCNDEQAIGYNIKQIIPTDENLQLTTENGLLVYDRNLDCIDSFAINTRVNNITSIFRDKSAGIWMLSSDKGLKFVNNYYRTTQRCRDAAYYQVAYAAGNLYLSDIEGNVTIADTALQHFRQVVVPNISASNKNVRNISLLPTGNGVYMSSSKNLALVNKSGLVRTVRPGDTAGKIAALKKVCYAGGTLYALIYDGIYSWDEQQGKIRQLYDGLFSDMALDSRGVFWLVTDNKKLCTLHRNEAGKYILKYMQDTYPALAGVPEPTAMICDTAGHVILAYDHMLVIYDPATKTATYHAYKNRITGCSMSGGRLLVYTGGYIDLYAYTGARYLRHDRYYNFDHTLYEDIIAVTTSGTSLYISAGNGITRMPLTNKLKADSSFLYHTHLGSVLHNGVTYWSPEMPQEFVYAPGRTVFNIACVSLSYGRNIVYRYYLEGIDNAWQQSTSAAVSYAALPPGSYRMHVMAVADEYELSSNKYVFSFEITPLWWQRKTVQLLAALIALALLLLLGIRITIIRKNKQLHMAILEKKMSEVQLGTLQAQMNPHFVFNALTSVQSYLKRNRNEEAGGYLVGFTRLIRLYLEFSRKRSVILEEEIEALRLYTDIESKRFNNRFVTYFREELKSGRAAGIRIPPMIIQPFVENAINHGLYHKTEGQGVLLLHFCLRGNELIVTIDDNGIGRERSAEINSTYRKAPSRGNEIVNERIKILAEQHMMHISIRTEDKKTADGSPAGTTVTITFKLSNISSL